MNKKILSNVLVVAMVTTCLFGCENAQKVKTITADTPYYSVTTGSFERDRNVYMDLDIKIPMITYSNKDGTDLIDSLNQEIESSLTSLIDSAKETALNTYETYLQSAKDNAKKDIEDKIAELTSKYESILGDTEKELLSNLNADSITNYPFLDMGKKNIFSDIISSDSETFPCMRRKLDKNDFIPKPNDENSVNGFTGTSDIIIPGLHNKNIIIVETTTAAQTETSIKINGRPGIAPSEDSERPLGDNFDGNFDGNFDDNFDGNFDGNFKRPRRSSQSELPKKDDLVNETRPAFEKPALVSTPSESKIELPEETFKSDEITLDNFYRDLRRLIRYNIPDDYILTIQYIPTTIECNYEVKCLDEDYLSLFVELSESRTTSTVKRLFYNVDLNNKKMVSLKDMLGDNYKETCVKCITEAIDKWSEDQKTTLIDNYNIDNYISESTPFFINNNHKPVIEIDKFAITIGSTGYHEFQIP